MREHFDRQFRHRGESRPALRIARSIHQGQGKATMNESQFAWKRWPATEGFLADRYTELLTENPWAKTFANRLKDISGTLLQDWVDHVRLNGSRVTHEVLRELGYKPRRGEDSTPARRVYFHPGADLPGVVVDPHASPEAPICLGVAIRSESLAAFLAANRLQAAIQGFPLGPYRECVAAPGKIPLLAVERRGYDGYDVFPASLGRQGLLTPQRARQVLEAREIWQTRNRWWGGDDSAGFVHAEKLVRATIDLVGRDMACELVFEVERDYWQSRNRAARAQKARQDELGLGWANHDHHTFRCSRRNFHLLIRVLEMLGFELREHFHAGEHAGWGAQVLEHPVTGIVIFADLDLAPEELTTDFAHQPLDPLPRPNTVGLWVALHGESFLEAGMHHLEAQFDFDLAREGLEVSAGIGTMKPFSDFPFLRQAFTKGEFWAVDPNRVATARSEGWITQAEADQFLEKGAVGSHLEILQRREGYKGFNQQAVGAILSETDPRKLKLDR